MAVVRDLIVDGLDVGDPRILLCRMARLKSWDLPHMAAPFWRLYLPLSSGGALNWRGRRCELVPGRWLLIAPETDCAASLVRPFFKAYGHFTWNSPGSSARQGVYAGALPATVLRQLRDQQQRPDARRLGLLLQTQFRYAAAVLPPMAFAPVDADYSPAVAQALALLSADPARTPGNAALGAAVGMHPGSLVRRFSREVGRSPQAEAMRLRLGHAAALLTESDDPIENVAIACGFSDRYHFTRAFARHWHQPPAAFRRLSRNA